jgi:multidrug/hemolysin transport system permease protein
MRILYELVKRNVRLYLRDKAAVFFSFLSVVIILALYILFLGKLQVDAINSSFGDNGNNAWLVSSWIMAGILTVSTITVPLGAVGNLIDDRADNILSDFYVSPINRNTLALSYLISAWVIGAIMVFFNLVIGLIYVMMQGGEFPSIIQFLELVGVMILSIMSFSSFFFFMSLFMKTRNAYGTLSTLVGTFVGFLGGIYIPIGQLGETVQKVMNAIPVAHAVTLMRQIYMEGAVNAVFEGAPSEYYTSYANMFGLTIYFGDYQMQPYQMVLSLVLFMLVFYGLSVVRLSKNKLN